MKGSWWWHVDITLSWSVDYFYGFTKTCNLHVCYRWNRRNATWGSFSLYFSTKKYQPLLLRQAFGVITSVSHFKSWDQCSVVEKCLSIGFELWSSYFAYFWTGRREKKVVVCRERWKGVRSLWSKSCLSCIRMLKYDWSSASNVKFSFVSVLRFSFYHPSCPAGSTYNSSTWINIRHDEFI